MCTPRRAEKVSLEEPILGAQAELARHNREHFRAAGILAVNLMGSPGSGKTAVLEATASALAGRRLAALAGDLATDRDAVRLRGAGIPCTAITTGTACHLDAELVHRALHGPAVQDLEFLFIENVGNLVCPALFDLGQAASVVALSVTEGEDKPLKYPVSFLSADLVLLTKIDLLPASGCTVEGFVDALAQVAPRVPLLPFCARTGEGVVAWSAWLENARRRALSSRAPAPATPPRSS